jgi:uncharacterized protein YecT (DUF1311 family)
MKLLTLLAACGCGLLAYGPAFGQSKQAKECEALQTQAEINICSARDFDAADKELNAQYQITRPKLRKWDADMPEQQFKQAEGAMVKAQRAWIIYRDTHCMSWGLQAAGGSMQPMLISSCMADLTRKRTAELKELTKSMVGE